MTTPTLKIFLSYGHQLPKHVEVALRIKADLEARGHKVWFDLEKLKGGLDWEKKIEQGIRDCDRFLLLMTPWSVRRGVPGDSARPDGYCLNELALACSLNKLIIPVLLDRLEEGQPLSIMRLQFLDLQPVVPLPDGLSHYESVGFPALVEAVETGKWKGVDSVELLRKKLNPLDFQTDIQRHTKRLTGRDWLLGEGGVVARWLNDQPESREFHLLGGPGIGKSAIATQMIHFRRQTAAFHFCDHKHEDSKDPRRTVASIAFQLSQRIPEYQQRLAELAIEEELTKPASTVFRKLLSEPLNALAAAGLDHPGTLLVVIDGLDEATTADGQNELARFLGQQWRDLPHWLRLFVTSRHDPAVTQPMKGLNSYEFDSESSENIADLWAFLAEMISRIQGAPPSGSVMQVLLGKSDGLFLYAHYIVEELAKAEPTLSLDRPEEFPQGLSGIYLKFFEREFKDTERYKRTIRPVLDVVMAAKGPLPIDLLTSALDRDAFDVEDDLDQLGTLFPRNFATRTVAPFHKSVLDWITNRDSAGGYTVNLKKGADLLLNALRKDATKDWSKAHAYTLSHFAAHLADAEQNADLRSLLFDLRWIREKLKRFGIQPLLRDDTLLPSDNDREFHYLRRALELSAHVLARNPEQLPGQLTGRLIGLRGDGIAKLVEELRIPVDGKPLMLPTGPGSHVPADSPLLRTFEGHTGDVSSVAISPDGRTAISGSVDGTLRLWDLSSGETIRTFEGHSNWVTSSAFSPDGKSALSGSRDISGSNDSTIRLWDIATGETMRTLEGHTSGVTSVVVSYDGKTTLSGSMDGTLRLWDVTTGQILRTFEGHSDVINSVVFSPDGKTALSGSWDKTLRLWDLATGQILRTFEGHSGVINSVVFSPDGKRALSGSWDMTLRLWDIATGETTRIFEGHVDGVTTVAFSPDAKAALSGSIDETLRLWDVATGETLRTLEGHSGPVSSLAFSPGGKTAISGCWDKTLRLWDVAGGELPRTFERHLGVTYSVAFSPEGKSAISGSADKTLRLWDVARGETIRTLDGHAGLVCSVAFSPEGKTAISGSRDKTLRLWDVLTSEAIRTFDGHTDQVCSVAFSPDGKTAISGSADKTLRLWDLAKGETIRTLQGHMNIVYSVAFSPDGKTALSGSWDKTLRLWDVASGETIRTLEGHTQLACSVVFSPDGMTALSASEDMTLRLWIVATGRILHTFQGHSGVIHSVSFSPDGNTALSGSWDKTLRLWDVATGECLSVFETDYPVSALDWKVSHWVLGNHGGYVVPGEVIHPA